MCFDFKELKEIFDKRPDESEKKLAEAVKGAVRVSFTVPADRGL